MIRRAALLLLVSAAPPADESMTVQGHRSRFQPAPAAMIPNPRFDPPGSENAVHDSDTGADLTRFGPAYSAATPAPPNNPAARSDLQDDPLPTGPPHP